MGWLSDKNNSLPWLNISPCYLHVKKHVVRPTDKLVILKYFLCQVQISEANDQSRIASFTCVSKVIDSIEVRMAILSSWQCIYVWSDGCSTQFRSRFTFVLLTHLHPDKSIEWNYNQAYHGKEPMNVIGGTIKNKVFQEVKSGRIVVDSPKDFAMDASCLIQSITTLYLPKNLIFEEPVRIENAPYIKDTLEIHKVKRKRNYQLVIFLKFYRLSFDEKPFYTHFYRKSSDPIKCGHERFEESPNRCPHCLNNYHVGVEWMECLACKQWYCRGTVSLLNQSIGRTCYYILFNLTMHFSKYFHFIN